MADGKENRDKTLLELHLEIAQYYVSARLKRFTL